MKRTLVALAAALVCAEAHAGLIASAIDGQTFYGVEQPRFDLYDERGACPEGDLVVEYVRPSEPPTVGCWRVADDLIVMTFPGDVTAHVERDEFKYVYHRVT